MSIHTVTKEITVHSEVEISGPPGASTEAISKTAHTEVDRVCKLQHLHSIPTDVYVSRPVYRDNRKWFVNITKIFRTTVIVDLED